MVRGGRVSEGGGRGNKAARSLGTEGGRSGAYVDLGVLKSVVRKREVSVRGRLQCRENHTYRFLRLSLMLSFEMVDKRVMSLTPAVCFLNPSFQSACRGRESA